jgi:hypothetical protein
MSSVNDVIDRPAKANVKTPDRSEVLISQAVGEFCMYGSEPEIWNMMRRKYAEQLHMEEVVLDTVISNQMRTAMVRGNTDAHVSHPKLKGAAKHGLAWEFVDTILPHTESDPAALLFQYVVAAGVLMDRKPHFRIEGVNHYSNMSVVMVGDTSKGRKGTAWGRVRQGFNESLNDLVRTGLSSGEGLISNLNGDETIDKRLLVYAPEFARVLKVCQREGNTLSDVLREAFDSGNLATMTRKDPLRVDGAHIGIIGHITRAELLRYLKDTEMANGFANRLMWIWVKRSKLLPEGGDPCPAGIEDVRADTMHAINAARPVPVSFDRQASEKWRATYKELSNDEPGLAGDILSRSEALVRRLALVQAVLNRADQVRLSELDAALAMWDYCSESVRYIFGTVTGDPLADRVLDIIRAKPGITQTGLSGALGRNTASADMVWAVDLLEKSSLIESASVLSPGRPKTTYRAI